ncbi:hypothetical protein T08_5868 [Trichinella sp. T8]|nr:hypothetical protein T08_5868 [Trichinella sp. T8]
MRNFIQKQSYGNAAFEFLARLDNCVLFKFIFSKLIRTNHNQNMLKQPLHLVICLPLRTAVSGSSHIRLFKEFISCYSLLNKKKSHYNDVRKEFHYE